MLIATLPLSGSPPPRRGIGIGIARERRGQGRRPNGRARRAGGGETVATKLLHLDNSHPHGTTLSGQSNYVRMYLSPDAPIGMGMGLPVM